MIDPATICEGSDAQFGAASAESRSFVADDVCGGNRSKALVSGAGSSPRRVALTGLETGKPPLWTVAYDALFGAVKPPDAAKGDLPMACVARRAANALAAAPSQGLGAAKTGARIGAQRLEDAPTKDGTPVAAPLSEQDERGGETAEEGQNEQHGECDGV